MSFHHHDVLKITTHIHGGQPVGAIVSDQRIAFEAKKRAIQTGSPKVRHALWTYYAGKPLVGEARKMLTAFVEQEIKRPDQFARAVVALLEQGRFSRSLMLLVANKLYPHASLLTACTKTVLTHAPSSVAVEWMDINAGRLSDALTVYGTFIRRLPAHDQSQIVCADLRHTGLTVSASAMRASFPQVDFSALWGTVLDCVGNGQPTNLVRLMGEKEVAAFVRDVDVLWHYPAAIHEVYKNLSKTPAMVGVFYTAVKQAAQVEWATGEEFDALVAAVEAEWIGQHLPNTTTAPTRRKM